MKNALMFYYGIDALIKDDNTFVYQNEKYKLILYNEYVYKTYELVNNLINFNIPCHKIIPNNNGYLYTQIDNQNYTLIKLIGNDNLISLNDIIFFNNSPVYLKYSPHNWYDLWINKIDYLEYQISEIGKKYPIIRSSISYYIGLAENAITLIKNIDFNNIYLSISHYRMKRNSTFYDLYDPFNMVIDFRGRDICEYFKDCFFNKKNIEEEILFFLNLNNFNYEESCCFFSRLLFPTYYFDIYEKIITEEIEESELNKIIDLASDYEMILKKVYLYFKTNINIPNIEWLLN